MSERGRGFRRGGRTKMKTLNIRTQTKDQMIDITDEVRRAVVRENVTDGICLIYVPHTTAGVTINENADPDVQRDMLAALERTVPSKADYRHAEGNAAAHVKASLMGASATVIVSGGRLVLGTWQAIFLCEFDGPRTRQCVITTLAAAGG